MSGAGLGLPSCGSDERTSPPCTEVALDGLKERCQRQEQAQKELKMSQKETERLNSHLSEHIMQHILLFLLLALPDHSTASK